MWLFTNKQNDQYSIGKKIDLESSIAAYNQDLSSSEEIYGKNNISWLFIPSNHKKTDTEVTIIKPNNVNPSNEYVLENIIKRMKTLRHPNILNWLSGSDMMNPKLLPGDYMIITERVISLKIYLKQKADSGSFNYIVSWGLLQIARAVQFLNENNQTHNAVRLDSVVVNKSGEWRLRLLDYMSDTNGSLPSNNENSQYSCPDTKNPDSYGLGCLIWEIFNVQPLKSSQQLNDECSRIPNQLLKDYKRLVSQRAAQRFSIAQFIRSATNKQIPGFLSNEYIDTLVFLEEIQIKDKDEIVKFMSQLGERINNFPDDICRHKILPHLMNGLQFGSAGVEVLIPVLKLTSLLEKKDFESIVIPGLIKLFTCPDRMTRVKLLDQLPNFVDALPDKVLQNQIFAPVCQGFQDVNPFVREATVKSMINFAPRLPQKTLDETVARHLTMIQKTDHQGGVRANATVCLAKIFDKFSLTTQNGLLLNAFLRSTRDPFPPSRGASICALGVAQCQFTPKDLCNKVLPCLSFALMDPIKDVRENAFKTFKNITTRLEELHNNGELDVPAPIHEGSLTNNQIVSNEEDKLKTAASASAEILGQFASMAFSVSSSLISKAITQSNQSKILPNENCGVDNRVGTSVQTLSKPLFLNQSKKSFDDDWDSNEDIESSHDWKIENKNIKTPHNSLSGGFVQDKPNEDDWFADEKKSSGWDDDGWDDFEPQRSVAKTPVKPVLELDSDDFFKEFPKQDAKKSSLARNLDKKSTPKSKNLNIDNGDNNLFKETNKTIKLSSKPQVKSLNPEDKKFSRDSQNAAKTSKKIFAKESDGWDDW